MAQKRSKCNATAKKRTGATVDIFKRALKGDDLSSRAYKKIIGEAIEIIKNLKRVQNKSVCHTSIEGTQRGRHYYGQNTTRDQKN